MTISISSSLPAAAVAATNSSARSAAAQPTQQVQAQPQADTVRLSESQQVYQLYNQGQRVSQIASNLSITVSAVNSYLGISDTTAS